MQGPARPASLNVGLGKVAGNMIGRWGEADVRGV